MITVCVVYPAASGRIPLLKPLDNVRMRPNDRLGPSLLGNQNTLNSFMV